MKQVTFPRIKPSLKLVVRDNGELYIGTASEGYILDADPFLQILRSCDGSTTITEISGRTFLRMDSLQGAIDQLRDLGIIEILDRPCVVKYSRNSGGDHQSAFSTQLRFIEYSLITHRGEDGGAREWNAREKYSVTITGDNRIARILLPLLQASGFTRAQIATDIFTPQQFDIRDINALTVTVDEIGKNKSIHHQELIRRSSLRSRYFGESFTSEVASHGNFVIATSPPRADQIQHWQSEGTSHIAVGDLVGTEIELSPVISPGITPCLRCIALHKADALPQDLRVLTFPDAVLSQQDRTYSELPASSATLVASLLTSIVSNHSHQNIQSTKNTDARTIYSEFSSQVINLLDPTAAVHHRRWNFHPECGCVDIRRRALPR